MNDKHTPLPWKTATPGNPSALIAVDGSCLGACFGKPESEANAALVIRSVNSHQDLLDACKEARAEINLLLHHQPSSDAVEARFMTLRRTKQQLIDAIDKAEGQVEQ